MLTGLFNIAQVTGGPATGTGGPGITVITPSLMFMIICGASALLGLSLFIRALRGNKIDDHPLCRKCKFDLTGSMSGDTTIQTCPECGSDVSNPKNRRIGNRGKRNGWMLAASILLLLIALLPVGWELFYHFTDIDWQRVKPVWLLQDEAMSMTGQQADDAWKELIRRLEKSELSSVQIDSVVNDSLANYGDSNKPWTTMAGDFIESAEANSWIDDEQWKKYLTIAATNRLKFYVRPKVRVGDPIAYQIKQQKIPGSSASNLYYTMQETKVVIENVLSYPTGTSMSSGLFGNGVSSFGSSISAQRLNEKVTPGTHTVTDHWVIRVYRDRDAEQQKTKPLIELSMNQSDEVEVLPISAPAVIKGITEPSASEQMHDALSVGRIKYYRKYDNLSIMLYIQPLPHPISHSAELVHGDERLKLSSVASNPTSRTGYGLSSAYKSSVKPFLGKKCKLILTPDPDRALTSVDIHEYWNHPIVLEDVVVEE